LSNRLSSRFDNRLYRVNGVLKTFHSQHVSVSWTAVLVSVVNSASYSLLTTARLQSVAPCAIFSRGRTLSYLDSIRVYPILFWTKQWHRSVNKTDNTERCHLHMDPPATSVWSHQLL